MRDVFFLRLWTIDCALWFASKMLKEDTRSREAKICLKKRLEFLNVFSNLYVVLSRYRVLTRIRDASLIILDIHLLLSSWTVDTMNASFNLFSWAIQIIRYAQTLSNLDAGAFDQLVIDSLSRQAWSGCETMLCRSAVNCTNTSKMCKETCATLERHVEMSSHITADKSRMFEDV